MNSPRHGEGDQPKAGGGGSPWPRRPTVYTARRLRHEMAAPEIILWQHLRTRPNGLKFRRQHPVDPYIVDFFCREAALVVEVDGAAHDMGGNPARDQARDARLQAKGLRVIRFAARDVTRHLEGVLQAILVVATNPLHHSPAASGSPPRAGEELS